MKKGNYLTGIGQRREAGERRIKHENTKVRKHERISRKAAKNIHHEEHEGHGEAIDYRL